MRAPALRGIRLAPVILLTAASGIMGGDARAEVSPRRLDGQIVFTSRPEQKPGTMTTLRSHDVSGIATGGRLEELISEVSHRYEMDPELISAVVGVESGFNHMAVSAKGARGLMQLMPDTARDYGVRDLHDARENLEGGVAYLRDLTRRYNGDLKLALAAYNAGPEAVDRAAGVPNYRETRNYIRTIESRYGQDLTSGGGSAGVAAAPSGRAGHSIRAMRDQGGNLVATNLGGRRTRIMHPHASPSRSR